MENRYQTSDKKSVTSRLNGMEGIVITEVRARVISQEKGLYKILYEGRENWAEVSGKYRYETDTVSDFPAVGDYVVASWPDDTSRSIISDLFPRKSVFIRKAAGTDSGEQVVAANIDTVFLCMSLNNDFNVRRLERYVALSWNSGATPVVVLTKTDLCEDIKAKISEVQSIARGVDVITVSSKNNDFDAVNPYLVSGKTVAFLGSSGVGKSTLINKIVGDDIIETAEIREDDKGRHTTTHRELITLKNGACVIDTPAMRELGMWNNESGLNEVFSDIEKLFSKCRFSDCTHTCEPGCAVLKSIKDGILSQDRWNSYQKLTAENKYATDESEYMQEKRMKFKEIAKTNKQRNNKK